MQLTNMPEQDAERRKWVLMTGVAAGVAVAATAVPFVASFAPSERARAMGASIEVDIAGIAPGGILTVEWRGKPVWILRRTPEMLAGLAALDAQLVDPASVREQQPAYAQNAYRSIKDEFVVLVGICTRNKAAMMMAPAISPAFVASRCLFAVKTPSLTSLFSRLKPMSCSTFELAIRISSSEIPENFLDSIWRCAIMSGDTSNAPSGILCTQPVNPIRPAIARAEPRLNNRFMAAP